MAGQWGLRGRLGGAALALLFCGSALAQKPPSPGAASDPLVGYWVFNGRSDGACVSAWMMAGMAVHPPVAPGGDRRVTSRRFLRQAARPGCPAVDESEKNEDLEGALRVEGDLVAVVLRGRDGRVHTFGYRLGDNTLAATCTDCIERVAPWRRTNLSPNVFPRSAPPGR